MTLVPVSRLLQANLEGFNTLAGALGILVIALSVWGGWYAYKQWKLQVGEALRQADEARKQAKEEKRRLDTELELRAVEHIQWLLTEVADTVSVAQEGLGASGNRDLQKLFKRVPGRLADLNLDRLFVTRDVGDPVGAVKAALPDQQVYVRALNLLQIFAAKLSSGTDLNGGHGGVDGGRGDALNTYSMNTAYRYSAVYFCDTVEDWAPLICIYRETVDTQFFNDGWALYQDWSTRLEGDGRRPDCAPTASE